MHVENDLVSKVFEGDYIPHSLGGKTTKYSRTLADFRNICLSPELK
jgi:hypothetical protein